jgi:hypothetical protein
VSKYSNVLTLYFFSGMEAIFHIRPLTRGGQPDIHLLPLGDSDDYTKMAIKIIRHIQEYDTDDIQKIVVKKNFTSVTIESQKISFLCHVQLGDMLCSLDRL